MKILLLAPHPFFQQRGTPIAEKMLLEVLSRHGHQVEVLTFPEGEDPGIPGVPIHRVRPLPGVKDLRPGFSWKKLLYDALMLWSCLSLFWKTPRKERFDAVHAVEESVFLARLLKLFFGVPYIYDMDSGLARQMTDKFPFLLRLYPLLSVFERGAVRGSVGVLAVCRSLEEQALAWKPGGLVARVEDVSLIAPGESGVLRPGPDLLFASPQGNRGPLVLYVGNLEPYQGIDLLLGAFGHTLRRVPDARLLVIGGSPESIEHYSLLAERMNLSPSVRFAGPRPLSMLGSYLRHATVLASPRTQGTNTPMKIYSYLDSGRALLATRLPTHTQVLDDDIAYLVEPEPAAMGEALARLLEDRALRERLAANAREFAQREFTPQAYEEKILRFYASVAREMGFEETHGETAGHEGRPEVDDRRARQG